MTDLASFSLHVIYICSFYFSFFLFEALGECMGRSQQNSFEAAPFGSRTSHRHLSVDDRVLADATLSLSFIFFFQSFSHRNGEVNLVLKYGCDMLGEWGSLVYR